MEIKKLFLNKRFKNIFITICEILVVAGIIFAILMFLQNKVNKEADKASGLSGTGTAKEAEKQVRGSGYYDIEVNLKKNAVIIYQYSKDKKSKKPYKVLKCSVGKDLKKGKYKTSDEYSWLDINGSWHKYNTRIGDKIWIQSAGYKDKYSNTLKKDSYNAIGIKKASGKCIILCAKDAEWIYSNCRRGTAVNVVNGEKTDKLPLAFEQSVIPYKYCGWDPTDTDKENPYKKMKNNSITLGLSTVYVEKGEKPEYISNLIAKDKDGKIVTGKLKYKKFDSDNIGTHKVKYTYKTDTGESFETVQKFAVVDTTPPIVTCSKSQFSYQVKGLSNKDMNNRSNVSAIENMVRSYISCNESGVKITVKTLSADELDEKNIPVIIKAQDEAGNVGSCQVMCEITVKKEKPGKKYEPSEKVKKELRERYNQIHNKSDKNQKKKNSEKETKKQSSKKDNEETTTVKE